MTTLSTQEYLAAIARHSEGLAAAARDNLEARVRHCPDWDVADLVWHVANVHWFWARIAQELPQEVPQHLLGQENRPPRPPDAELVDAFEAGARHLVEVLGGADQSARCWTWAPQHQQVGFITRHQVQEAAVHHWDAADARGESLMIEGAVAADAVEEFLTVSVSTDADPAEPPRPPLAGTIRLRTPRTSWVVTDGAVPGTVSWRREPPEEDSVGLADSPAAQGVVAGDTDPVRLLLWLYGRVDSPFSGAGDGDTAVLDRLRALAFTD